MNIPSKMPHGGLGKLNEECGEVVQILGKYFTLESLGEHWDGTVLGPRLEDELGDLTAAIRYVQLLWGMDKDKIEQRAKDKLELFLSWLKEEEERNA